MITRRRFASLAAAAGAGLLTASATRARAADGPKLNDDGLYEEPFFIQSFLDLGEDLAAATQRGRRFAIMWELKGCPYCKETHFVNFADPAIRDFVSGHFDILQLNLIGAREVTDFDGKAMEERELARRWGIRFTPTFMFFPETPEAVGGRPGNEAEVARMPGYFKPPHFLAMFHYVEDKAYEQGDFRGYLKRFLAG
ncbi:Thioredoxin-related protein [Tistlia consotensis]|uniref:Thioredoxin-related protein n=1 Tax=Tistlia consotensis USBA 355 TaxID=560819 RepID=A0A1Y6B363_9PROT|nr:thioredoxin family protein [Tistlia consotensis]SME89059.1 Thioredoxin-related protein [Tistlia consotensis USBA 355]SNR25637.1 Thioredoxin-related protein [Tistlia consotensis]